MSAVANGYATFFKNADAKFAGCRIPVEASESRSSLKEFIELLSSTVFNEKIYQLVQIPKRKKVKSVADITSGVYVCTTKSLGEAVDTSVKYKTLPVKTFAYGKDGSITEVTKENVEKEEQKDTERDGGEEGPQDNGTEAAGASAKGVRAKSKTGKSKQSTAGKKKSMKRILPTGSKPKQGKKERKFFKIPARGSKEYIELVAAALKVQRFWRQHYAIRSLKQKVKQKINLAKQEKKDAKREKKMAERRKRKDAAQRLHGGSVKSEKDKDTGVGGQQERKQQERKQKGPLTDDEIRTVGGLLGTRKMNRKVVPLKLKRPEDSSSAGVRDGDAGSLAESSTPPPVLKSSSKKAAKTTAKQKPVGRPSPSKPHGPPLKKISSSSDGSRSTAAKRKGAAAGGAGPKKNVGPKRHGSKERRGSKVPAEEEPEEEEVVNVARIPNLRQHEYTAAVLPPTSTVYDWVTDNPNYLPIDEERKLWSKHWAEYLPTKFTAKQILDELPDSATADNEMKLSDYKFNAVCKVAGAQINRNSHLGKYTIDPGNSMPLNPIGRTNVQGRGVFNRYGPNHGAEMILSRWKRKGGSLMRDNFDEPMLEVLMTKKGSGNEWHLPGGLLDPGAASLNVNAVLEREFESEMRLRKMPKTEKTHLREYITSLSAIGKSVYKGIPNDPRNTDNAWCENSVMHYHDKTGQFSSLLKRESDHGTSDVPSSPGAKARADAALAAAATTISSGGGGRAGSSNNGAAGAAVPESVQQGGRGAGGGDGSGADEGPPAAVSQWVAITPATNLFSCIETYVMTIRENLVAQTGGALAKRRKRVNLKKWNVARGFMMERTKLTELRKTNTGNVIFKYVTSSLVYTKDNRATLMKCIKPAVMAAEIAAAMKTQAEATAKEMADEAAAEAATKGKGKGPPKQQTVLYSPDSEPMCLTDSCEDYSTLEIFFKAIFAPNPLNFDEETLEDLTIVEARAKAAAEALAVKADAKAIEAARAARAAASAADSDSEGEDEPKDHAHLFLPNMDPSNPHHHAHKRGSHHKLHGPGILEEGGQGSAFSSGRSVKRSSVDSRAASGRSALSSRTNKSGVSGRSARSSRSGASARSTKSANVAARTAAMAGIAATTAAEKAIKAKEEVESMLHHDGIPAPRVAEDALSTNLDILDVELPALVIRCEFSRNLPGKFPIAMTIIERLAAEERLADVFEILKTKKGFAGTYYSFTPDTKHQTIGPVLQGNLESRGLMLNADVLSDNVARYPSVANDFPAGRGVYVAENNSQFVVWVGEVDQIKIITQKKGKEADEIYELGRSVLNEMTAILREMPPPPEPEPKPEKKPKKRRSSVSSVASPDGGILSRQKSGMDGKREPSSIRSKSGMGTRAKSAVGIDGQTRSPGASLRKIGSKEPSHLGDGGLGDLHSMLNSAGSRRSQARSARSARSVMSIVSVEKSVKAQQTPSNPLNPSNETSGWAWDPQFGFLTVDPAGAGAGFDCSAMMVFRANRSRDQIAGYCYKAGVRVNVAPNRVKEANSRSIRIEPRRFYGQSDRAVIGGLFSGIRLLRKMMVIGPKGGGKKGNLRR